jgi:hypothetical protein
MSAAAHRCTAARACAALDSIAALPSASGQSLGLPQHQSGCATGRLMCCTAAAPVWHTGRQVPRHSTAA